MDTMLQDLRYALRTLRKTTSITLLAVLSIGLAIGANATIFTWLDGLVLHPLPAVPALDRIVQLHTLGPQGAVWSVSYPDLQDWRAQTRGFTGLAGYDIIQASVRTTGQAERAFGMIVTANYFDVLGVRPWLGRGFVPAEDSAPGAHPVVVLSYRYWSRHFSGDSGVIGRAALFNGQPFTVIGVMPPQFVGNFVGLSFDFWAPLTMLAQLTGGGDRLTSRDNQWLDAFARLKPGGTLAQARTEMRTVEARLAATYQEDRILSATADGFGSAPPVVWFRPAFLALLGITAVVLLIACANVANLLLTRAAGRVKEMSVRVALGARRSRLVRQLLLESGVLAVAGGAVGVAIAAWSKGLFGAFVPNAAPVPISLALPLSWRVLAFATGVTTLTVLLFGLIPALRASRPDLIPALKDEAVSRGMSRSTLRGALAVAQVALSMIALVAAGLFARSLRYAQSLDRGFTDPAHVLLIGTDMQLAGYSRERALPFYDQMLERVRATPGVRAASLVANVPLGFGGRNSSGATVEGYTPQPGENMSIQLNRAGPDYFHTMGTRILAGREFTAQDRSDGQPVAVVNQAFVDRYWRGLDPIGRHIGIAGAARTVIGVVATGKYHALDEAPTPFVFLPLAQQYAGGVAFVVRTTVPAPSLVEPLRREFAAADPGVPFLDPQTLEEFTGAAVFVQRAVAWLLGAFGGLALVLAAMGIYGVVGYGVAQRTRELGIRTALGAGRREIFTLILSQGARITLVGLLTGGAAALGVAQVMRHQLLGVRPSDPATLAAISALLAGVALLACYLPARRAARVDPLVALRSE
jgi:putative ABC transport system permease protein